jgi:hypothetical protein
MQPSKTLHPLINFLLSIAGFKSDTSLSRKSGKLLLSSIQLFCIVFYCVVFLLNGCNSRKTENIGETTPDGASDGPIEVIKPVKHILGDKTRGREVFRFETFGNEGFWKNAGLLPNKCLRLAYK